jgi:hypothetical protein
VGRRVVFSGTGEIKELNENDVFTIAPGAYVGVVSRENFNFPLNVLSTIGTKRRFSYEGLILLTGNLVEPGYQGHLLFTVFNASNKPAFLQFEEKLCTLVFHQIDCDAPHCFHDASLIEGKFPSEFVRSIGQTDPSGYARIQQEVAKIQDLTTRLSRLESEYNDVRGPIKELTKLVQDVTKDLQEVKGISRENTENIKTLVDSAKKTQANIEDHQSKITTHAADINWIKWAATSLVGAFLLYWLFNVILPLFKH